MSRIGRLPIAVPAGVEIKLEGQQVQVKGPKGVLSHTVADPIRIGRNDAGEIEVTRPDDERLSRSLHGLTRTLVANMVTGVTEGYKKTLALVGTGYRAEAKGDTLNITIGYSHPVIMKAPQNIAFATPNQTTIEVSGIDKQQVGNIAADIRAVRSPEPYHGKGIRYADEVVRQKEGKTGKK